MNQKRIDYQLKPPALGLTDAMVETCESCGHIAALHKSHGCSGPCRCRGFRGAQRRAYQEKSKAPDVGDFQIGGDGALLCFCGDARSDHLNGDGPCKLNGLGHGLLSDDPANKCHAYRANKGDDEKS